MKKVFVTGASGFLGQHCVAALCRLGFEVHAVSRAGPPATKTDTRSIAWHRLNLANKDRTALLLERVRPDYLLHLAWLTDPRVFWNSTENDTWVDISENLITAFRSAGGRRLLVAGSCAEYDWSVGHCHETNSRLAPETRYGRAKLALFRRLQQAGQGHELSWAWARIFFLYGPGGSEQRLPGAVLRAARERTQVQCTSGQQIRDFLHIADCCDAIVTLLDSTLEGPVNVASGQPVRLRELILSTAELLGIRDLVHLGALPSRPGEPTSLTACTNRLNDELSWRPRFNLKTGLQNYINAFHSREKGSQIALAG